MTCCLDEPDGSGLGQSGETEASRCGTSPKCKPIPNNEHLHIPTNTLVRGQNNKNYFSR